METIQATDESRLPATRWTDDGSHRLGWYVDRDFLQCLTFTEPRIERSHSKNRLYRNFFHHSRPIASPPKKTRAEIFMAKTKITKTSAPAHAWTCHCSNGEM